MTPSSDRLLRVLYQWLEAPETFPFLIRFVQIKYQQEENAVFFHGEEPEDIRQEFLVFVINRFFDPARLSPDLLFLIHSAQFSRILELAWQRFIWHLRERARNKTINPRGYLYRLLRENLKRNHERFAVIPLRLKYLAYYPINRVPAHLRPGIVAREDDPAGYGHLPPPPPVSGQPADKYLFSNKWLLDTADFFWRQVMQAEPRPFALPIRACSRYLADQYPWLNTPQRQEGTDSDGVEELADDRETQEQHLLRINGLQSVASLAAQLATTWPMAQRQVFVWRLADPPLTYDVIAERLGLADHNKAYALFQKTLQSLLRFTGDWPGLPLSELPEEVAISFIEEMKRCCKNSPLCP